MKKRLATEERLSEALKTVPRITDETVAEHREDVLRGARKFIYPLEHSKHRIVRISSAILAMVIVVFFVYCVLALYNFQSTSGFAYGVTKVIPFPVAKAGPRWVSYESYLFELRRNMHYYHTQQQTDFSSKDGKEQLKLLKKQAMAVAIQSAFVKELAAKYKITVSTRQVDSELALVRSQNRLGSNDQVFKNVLNQYWGWSESDFRRELSGQLLQQNVVVRLDTATTARAGQALKDLKAGADFGATAAKYSDDASTKDKAGQYPIPISQDDRDISPQITSALFQLKAGQTTDIINTNYTLEILKLLDTNGNTVHASHIQFKFQDISIYTSSLQKQQKISKYIKV